MGVEKYFHACMKANLGLGNENNPYTLVLQITRTKNYMTKLFHLINVSIVFCLFSSILFFSLQLLPNFTKFSFHYYHQQTFSYITYI